MAAPLPKEPMRGDPLDANWGRAVARALRSQRVSGGPGIRASQGPDGTTISLAPGLGAGGGGTWTGAAPLIARVVNVSATPGRAPCQTLDGRNAGSQLVAALELAGGTGGGGGPYRVVAYPHVARVAAVEEEVQE